MDLKAGRGAAWFWLLGRRLASTGSLVMLSTVLLVILILLLIGALPTWPHSREWGYYPSGGLGIVVVIVLILLFMGGI
jgi:asparagine N-glycosylation enzyme membrane subunit Stt3